MKFSLDRACKAVHEGLHPHQPEEISQVAEPVMDHPDTHCEQSVTAIPGFSILSRLTILYPKGDDKRERMYTDASIQTDEQLLQQMVAALDTGRSEDNQSLQHTVAVLDADRSEDRQSLQYMISAPDADESEDNQLPQYPKS
ncbi:MAG: hypothetical protein FRX48_05202 [Lasallia pustulata]|uniref:Uncharacterized protein n=1 Tax=Lasallia pustulata TaxID=136370 RepID=A0A5M8PPG8_9LECA|nr:MAG: hypothetical protein FRX48_05202 [Lasallia pustulata]